MATILGLDPGATNFGYCILQDGVPQRSGLLACTVKDMSQSRKELLAFLNEVRPLAKQCKHIIAERYQTRSVGGGATVMGSLPERVNLMLGSLLVKRDCVLVPAMVWKGQVKRVLNLDLLYKVSRTPPHIVDAGMLALWHHYKLHAQTHPQIYQHTGKSPFDSVSLDQIRKFVAALERSYDGRLRNVKDRNGRIRDFKADFTTRSTQRNNKPTRNRKRK